MGDPSRAEGEEYCSDGRTRSRQQQRDGRKREVRGSTIAVKNRARNGKKLVALEVVPPYWRPSTRAECVDVPRPCPYVGCRFNLYLDVLPTGNIKLNFPDLEPEEMGVSCVLDAISEGPLSVERTGEVLNIVRERVRQVEALALEKLQDVPGTREMCELVED